ncbi:MAG: TatD family hydrolase [Cytophagales bacterium]|nr:TatD family hydrolase [Cytophagales bacterium]
MWIDSHCHLDAPEFDADRAAVRALARQAGVGLCVIPAVARSNFAAVRELAQQHGDAYALGIHPLYVPQANEEDLDFLASELAQHQNDPHLVAVGEIGLDYFVPELCTPAMRERQWHFYTVQLALAKRFDLPVIVHLRRSADMLLKGLRDKAWTKTLGGIVHAFNGSLQQAQSCIDLGFKLGFGGTLTYERSQQIRRLARELPLESLVLETDAPDIAPQWLYVTAAERAQGRVMQKNTPTELPKIGATLAKLRAIDVMELQTQTTHNIQSLFKRFQFAQKAQKDFAK